jgi:uncharacterized membrane protein
MGSGADTIRFTNRYPVTVNITYIRLDEGCGDDCGDPWDIRGWVVLEPGQSQTRANPTSNRWFYFFAEAVDGSFWAGPFSNVVRDTKFQHCRCAPSTSDQPVGFRQLDTQDADEYEVVLIP